MTPVRRYNQSWLPSIFDDFFDTNWMNKTNATAPAINVIENDAEYLVEGAGPGKTTAEFDVHDVEEGTLVIAMEKKSARIAGDVAAG